MYTIHLILQRLTNLYYIITIIIDTVYSLLLSSNNNNVTITVKSKSSGELNQRVMTMI